MTAYGSILLTGLLICFGLYAFRIAQNKLKWSVFTLSIPFILILGYLFAKILYILCFIDFSMIDEYWFEDNFLVLNPSEFSVFGGAVGVCIGVLLACRCTRQKASAYLDAFAPCGAFLLCAIRIDEIHLERLGAGALLPEGSPLAKYPLAIQNEYGEWFGAVFLLEAVFALICGIIFLAIRLPRLSGLRFELTAFFLAVPQIFCESLRARGMKWGFVRIEQLFCGLLVFFLVTYACTKTGHIQSFFRRYWPSIAIVFCIGLIVFVEFALDKFNISDLMCYTLMWVSLLCMSAVELYSVKRRVQALNQ